eukprot:4564640-Amphidinium_carterae.1
MKHAVQIKLCVLVAIGTSSNVLSLVPGMGFAAYILGKADVHTTRKGQDSRVTNPCLQTREHLKFRIGGRHDFSGTQTERMDHSKVSTSTTHMSAMPSVLLICLESDVGSTVNTDSLQRCDVVSNVCLAPKNWIHSEARSLLWL